MKIVKTPRVAKVEREVTAWRRKTHLKQSCGTGQFSSSLPFGQFDFPSHFNAASMQCGDSAQLNSVAEQLRRLKAVNGFVNPRFSAHVHFGLGWEKQT
jgi:hypothetical protein